jgi:hypothetical protein
VTCGTGFGFGFGLGFGVGVALACRVGVADGALDVPGLLLAAGAAAGVAVHAVARQATAPTTNINRMGDSIGTRCDGTVKGLAAAMPGAPTIAGSVPSTLAALVCVKPVGSAG